MRSAGVSREIHAALPGEITDAAQRVPTILGGELQRTRPHLVCMSHPLRRTISFPASQNGTQTVRTRSWAELSLQVPHRPSVDFVFTLDGEMPENPVRLMIQGIRGENSLDLVMLLKLRQTGKTIFGLNQGAAEPKPQSVFSIAHQREVVKSERPCHPSHRHQSPPAQGWLCGLALRF